MTSILAPCVLALPTSIVEGRWMHLQIPGQVTSEEWARLLELLDAMRPGIVDDRPKPGPPR